MASMALDTPEEHRAAARQLPYSLPPGATEIILVRHGASAPAVAGQRSQLVMGHGDPALSEGGHRQAHAVMARLRNEPVAAVFITPLQRTRDTAAPLAGVWGIEPQVIDELIEVGLGDWEGGEYRLRAAAGDPIVSQVFAEQRWDAIPGGESLDSLAQRARTGVVRIAQLTGPDRVAVAVLHGGVIGEICRQATDSRPFAFVHSDNASISRIIVGADGAWLLRGFNDVSHLKDGAGSGPRR